MILGTIIGLASSLLPVKILFGAIAGIALFIFIYSNLKIGIYVFLALNLTIPQAGPGFGSVQMAGVGERGFHFNLHEIVLAMVLIAWIMHLITKKATWRTRSPMIVPVILYVLTSILACFIGLVHGSDPLVMIYRFVRTVAFVYVFFLVINIIKSREDCQKLILIILICTTLVAGFGLVQRTMGQAWSERFAERVLKKMGFPGEVNYVAGGAGEYQAFRVNSTFAHPNILGGYLILALPFFVSLLWYYKRRWIRLLLLLGLTINLSCLFFTGSRAAWIAGGFIAVIYGVLGLLDRRMILALATLLLVILLLIVIIKPPEFVKQRTISLSAKEATRDRMHQYKQAVDLFMEYPFFGLGMGMEGQRIIRGNIRYTWAAVENAFLTYLVSHGVIGLAAFLLLFFVFWVMLGIARNNARGDPFIYYNSEALVLGLLGLAICNVFGAWLLFAIPMVTLFWFFLGMGSSLYNINRGE